MRKAVRSRSRNGAGQASVELVAVLPALAACVLIAAHALPTGWALWSAADAARAGARAEHVGGDPHRAVRRALPARLLGPAEGGGERVRVDDKGVAVRVAVPSLLPGMRERRIGAAARLEPGGG